MNQNRYYIVDDDIAVRNMIAEIIEDEDLGIVVGESEDGHHVDALLLGALRVDVLVIDQLMPERDGLETIRTLEDQFEGQIVMISQIDHKETIGEAYQSGVTYYITKPINRLELMGVLMRVNKQIQLENSISDIHRTLSGLQTIKPVISAPKVNLVATGKFLLTELGIIGSAGSKDLLEQLAYLESRAISNGDDSEFPSLKELFTAVAQRKLGPSAEDTEVRKEVKAAEQRVRRALSQGLNHLASLGLVDFNHPKFEEYASTFFNFTEVRQRMMRISANGNDAPFEATINAKRFIKILYHESLNRSQK